MLLRALLTVSLLGLLCSPVVGQTSCAALYGQCGGSGYTGASCCQTGSQCVSVNAYYYQCTPASSSVTSASSTISTSSETSTTSSTGTTSSSSTASTSTGPQEYTTTTSVATTGTVTQAAYPSANASSCGDWALVDNVCCPYYCLSNNESSSCDSTCTGACGSPDSSMCKSGTMWGEQHTVGYDETWHYSRSTHFGLTSGGACGFGLYGLCTQNVESWVDSALGSTCTAFCTAYPLLCTDPTNVTMRGNFAAPNGDYYTQFWSSLASQGALDNYLSCGECFELVQTYPNGSDYAVGDAGYTPPIYLEIVDSCPCDANPKWCCGSGADHCGEINFEYGCPLPAGSHHMDLSDIAMGRLQGNGSLSAGVIPIRYKRVPCPSPGNVYIWLRDGGGPYYFALTAVNTNGVGSLAKIEIKGAGQTAWTALVPDPNYTESRPQERYGAYTIPQNTGPYNLPVGVRLTSPNGEVIVNEQAITSWTAPATAPAGFWYIDLGVQFTTI